MPKKKTKKRRKSAARRVGALALNPSSEIVMYGSIAAGFLFATPINSGIDKLVGTSVDPKLIAGGQVGLGGAYMFLKKGKKNLALTLASGIMIGAGAKRGLAAFGLGSIGGYQSVPAINGYQSVPAVNGAASRRIAGYNPGNGGMGLYGTQVPMRSAIAGVGDGSGVRDR